MKSLVRTDPGVVAWHDTPEPDLAGPGEALVRPLAVALCDADHALVSGAAPMPGPIHLGHECVAEVVAVGGDVRSVAPGDRVVVPFQISCGECDRCRRGITDLCLNVRDVSMFGFGAFGGEWGGFLSDLVRIPFADAMLVKAPADIDPHAIASASDNVPDGWRCVAAPLAEWPGADVLVLGGGCRSIALYAVDAARALGAGSVTYMDTDDTRLSVASDLGAEAVAVAEWPRHAERRYPVVVDAGTSHATLNTAIRSTDASGHCTHVGILFEPVTEMPLLEMYTRGIHFHTSRAPARALLPTVLEHVASGALRPERVTSRIADWADAPTAVLEPHTKLVLSRTR